MRLEFSPFVEDDLDTIASYIALDNPRRAVTFLREIRAELHVVARTPLIYRLRPEIGEEARLAIVGQCPNTFLPGSDQDLQQLKHHNRNWISRVLNANCSILKTRFFIWNEACFISISERL